MICGCLEADGCDLARAEIAQEDIGRAVEVDVSTGAERAASAAHRLE
jgi:hypothetical protein